MRCAVEAPFRSIRQARAAAAQSAYGAEIGEDAGRWTCFPSSRDGDLSSLFLYLSERELKDERTLRSARDASQAIASYLDRCKLARQLWRMLGAPDGSQEDRADLQRRVDDELAYLLSHCRQESSLPLWRPLLSALQKEIAESNLPMRLDRARCADVANLLTAAVAAPRYDQSLYRQCEMLLSQRPFSLRSFAGERRHPTLDVAKYRSGISKDDIEQELAQVRRLFKDLQSG
jgi:hypothetical protein